MSSQAEWPFENPENTAVFSTVGVMRHHEPICRVCHDNDGTWQFLSGAPVTMADAMIVSLKEAVATDRSLLQLADLPLGWIAIRENPQSPWQRAQHTGD
jgi:hypothetical protein